MVTADEYFDSQADIEEMLQSRDDSNKFEVLEKTDTMMVTYYLSKQPAKMPDLQRDYVVETNKVRNGMG